MNAITPENPPKSNDIAEAQLEVARAERALNDGVHEVSLVGRAGIEQAFAMLKPVLITAVVAGGVVWLVSAARRPPRSSFERASGVQKRSLVREALRTLVLSLASAAARRLADALVSSGKDDHPVPTRHSAPPHEVSTR